MDLYRSGLDVLPGSAMSRTKHNLGFLAVRVQLLLTPGPVYGLYLEGEPPQKMLRRLASCTGRREVDVSTMRKCLSLVLHKQRVVMLTGRIGCVR